MLKIRLDRRAFAIRFGFLATLTMASTACDARTPAAGTVAVIDSAGVRIIDLGADPQATSARRALEIEPHLVVRSPEDDGGSALFDVRDVQPISGGRIAVANGGTNEILVFDDSGHRVATWGGFGEGPGEFRRLQWLALKPPDTLAAGDYGTRRVTLLDADGGFVRGFGAEVATLQSSSPIPPRPLGLLRDGSLVAATFESPAADEGTVRPAVELFAIAPVPLAPRETGDGATSDAVQNVGIWPGDEISIYDDEGALQVFNTPFGRRLHILTSAEGIWIGDDARWEVHEYSAQGQLRTVVRSAAPLPVVTDQLFEKYLDHRYRSLPEGHELEELQRLQRAAAVHATAPSFGRILALPGSGIAVGDYETGSRDMQQWLTVATDGTVKRLEVPANFDVMRWGTDWILAVVRDELGREEIHRYRTLDARGGS